jgi:hypothetical protein
MLLRRFVHGEETVPSIHLRKAGALVAGLLAAAAVPAVASAAPVTPELQFAHVALVPGGPAKLQSASFWAYEQNYTLHDVTAVIDASHLDAVATAKLEFDDVDDHCAAAGSVFTCTFEALAAPEGYAGLTFVSYRAATGAKAGDEGQVSIKVTSRELGTLTRTAKITVAEGVSLAADGESTFPRSAEPGATVAVPLGVRNDGVNPITGVDLFFFVDPWYSMAKHYSNCVYGTSAGYCHFDTELAAGTAYAVSDEIGIKVRADAPAPEVIGQTYNWLTPTDNRDNIDLVDKQKPVRGTDGALTLTAKPKAQLKGVPQTDTSGGTDWQTSIVAITGTQEADLAAVGAAVTGKVGATVTAKVGVANRGPAFVFGFPDPAAKVTVTVPAGTTVVTVPDGCVKSASAYVCTTTAVPLDVKAAATWPFQLRIDRAGRLTGTVSVTSSQPDRATTNDKASLVVAQPVAAGNGDHPGGNDDDGGQGGGLPITGAPIMLIAGVGLLLLAGGVAAYLVGRRRMTS